MMPEFQRNFSAWSILLKASVEANAIPEITFKPDEAGTYYCELINVVNGKDSEVVRTEYIYARKN